MPPTDRSFHILKLLPNLSIQIYSPLSPLLTLATTSTMSSDDLIPTKIKLAEASITTHRNLALTVATKIGSRVYVFDKTCHFSTPPFDVVIIDNIRTN